MLPTTFGYLVLSLSFTSFLCSAIVLYRLHSAQIRSLLRAHATRPRQQARPKRRATIKSRAFNLSSIAKSRAPYMDHDNSDLADRNQHSLSLDWVPLVRHYASTNTVNVTQPREEVEKAPHSPLRAISAPCKPLVLLAISDQVSTILVGIVVIRWYSDIREDSHMLPSTPFTDAIATFCLSLALCTRAIIVLSVSVLGCLQMLTNNRPNLGRADWRLHATELIVVSTIASLSALLSPGRYAPCLFLLATLLTLCTCTTAAVFSLLTVVWSCREKALLTNRMLKDDKRKQAFVLRGITAGSSASQGTPRLERPAYRDGDEIVSCGTAVATPNCAKASFFQVDGDYMDSGSTSELTRGHETTLGHSQRDSFRTEDAFSASRRAEAAETEYDRIMARATNEVFGLHSREQSDSVVVKSQHFHSSSVSSMHRRKPSGSQSHVVANVYGDTYVDGGELGEWRRTSASLDSVQLTPPGSPTSPSQAEGSAGPAWSPFAVDEGTLDGSEHAQMGHPSDGGCDRDHFEYSSERDTTLNQSSASEYSQPLRSPAKVRPLSTSSIFSAFTAQSHQTERRDSGSSFRPLDDQDFFGTIPALSASQSVASLRSLSRHSGLNKQSSSSRLREQASSRPHPLSRCFGEGRSSPDVPIRDTDDPATARLGGTAQGPELTAEILEEERKSKEESIRVTVRACGFLLIMWCAMALSMPYILHPVKDGGNEEVSYVYALLLVTGIFLSGPLNLIQVLLTNDQIFMASSASTPADGGAAFASTNAHGRGGGRDDGLDSQRTSIPGGYPFTLHGEGQFRSAHFGASNYNDHGMAGDSSGAHHPYTRSCSALSYSAVSVASVPYSTKHWRAGKVRGDRILRPRRALRRAANMLDPKPKLDVLPPQRSETLRSKVGRGARRRSEAPKRSFTAPLRWVKRAREGSQQALPRCTSPLIRDHTVDQSASHISAVSLSSPGVGRGGVEGERDVSEMQLIDHSLSHDRTHLVLDEGVPDCIIDITPACDEDESDAEGCTPGRPFVLDGFSAMLLPHIAPGVKIGPNIPIAADSERDFIEEYEDYQRRMAQSGEWWSFSEDRTNASRAANSQSGHVVQASVCLSSADSSTWGFSRAGGIRPVPRGIRPVPRGIQKAPVRTGKFVPFRYRRDQDSPRAFQACALNVPLPLRNVTNGVKTAGHVAVSNQPNTRTPIKGSRLTAGFPSQHLASAYAMLECTPPTRTPKFARVISDQERLGGAVASYSKHLYGKTKVRSLALVHSNTDRKQRSSTSRAMLHSAGAVTPGKAYSLRHAGHSLDCQDSRESIRANEDQDRRSDRACLNADRSNASCCLDSEEGGTSDITPPMQSTPKEQGDAGTRREALPDSFESPTQSSPRTKGTIETSDPAAQWSAYRKRAWKIMPEAIPLSPVVSDGSSRGTVAVAPAIAPFTFARETARMTEVMTDGTQLSGLGAGDSHRAVTSSSMEVRENREESAATVEQGIKLAAEDTEASMMQSLSPAVLDAFARRAVGSYSQGATPHLSIDVARYPGKLAEKGLLSPASACVSTSGSEARKSLGSSLGLHQDRLSSRWPSPARGDLSTSELLSVSQQNSARNSVSPSVASSVSRRRSLGSELGLLTTAESLNEVADDTQPDTTVDLDAEPVATSVADKRSTGGTITTTDSSFLSSELVLSPVGSGSMKSPESKGCKSPRESPARAPESPISQLARRHGRSVSDDVQEQHRPTQSFNLRQLSTLDYHMHLNPHLNERLPTLEEASEEASHSACGALSQRHISPYKGDSEWGILSRQLDRIYQHARSPGGSADYSIADSLQDEPLTGRILPGKKHASQKVDSPYAAHYGSPLASPQTRGWLHIVDRQTRVITTEAHSLIRSSKDRNGSGCSRVTMTAATPQRTIGMRSEFWTTQNQPLPPLPFDIVGNLANAAQRSSTLEYVDGMEDPAEDSELPWAAQGWHPRRSSDVWSQASEVEIIEELNEWQRMSAEHVRNTPQRGGLHLSAQRTVKMLEKRKSSSTLLKGRQSMSSLLGLGKAHPTSEVGSGFSRAGDKPINEIHRDSRTNAVGLTSTPSSQWTMLSSGRLASNASSLGSNGLSAFAEEVATEQVLMEAELERLLREDAHRSPSSDSEAGIRLVEDTMNDFHLGGGRSVQLPDPAPQRKVKRIPVPRATEARMPLRERRSVLSTIRQGHMTAADDSDSTLVPHSNTIKSLPSLNDSLPHDCTLQAVTDNSLSVTAVSRSVSACSQKEFSKATEQPSPLLQHDRPRSHIETATKTDWPASTPARARHLSQMPEIEGAFRLLMAMSPSPVKETADETITGKKRWPRLSEAHLGQSTFPRYESQAASFTALAEHGKLSPRRFARPRGPRQCGSPVRDENVNPF